VGYVIKWEVPTQGKTMNIKIKTRWQPPPAYFGVEGMEKREGSIGKSTNTFSKRIWYMNFPFW